MKKYIHYIDIYIDELYTNYITFNYMLLDPHLCFKKKSTDVKYSF